MPRNIIVMSNSTGGTAIALPAYNSLDRILKLSFLMTQTVDNLRLGNLRLGHKNNRPKFSLWVYLNFARYSFSDTKQYYNTITNNSIPV